MTTYKVGYFVGSLSSTSINRLLSKALVRLAPPELELTEIPIKDLPLYSQDHDADFPPVARALKKAIADVDAVLFVTPEFNRSTNRRAERQATREAVLVDFRCLPAPGNVFPIERCSRAEYHGSW